MTLPSPRAPNWRTVATELAARLPAERLHPAVRAWMQGRRGTEKWSVGFSGGSDSLTLLLLLWAHWPTRRSRLQALHFDHRLRGAESKADAAFCRKVCRALRVRYIGGVWNRGDNKRRVAGGTTPRAISEAEARAARFAFFARHGRILWFGHQQDDIAETIFMRLARGSGSGGLAAPRPVHPFSDGRTHLRPLLTLQKREIVTALRAAGARWREDSTNQANDYFRNRVRRAVLPAWCEAAGRDALAGAARSRELLEEDDRALDAWLEEIRPQNRKGELSQTVLADKPIALARRALHRWLAAQPEAGVLARPGFDALLTAFHSGKSTRQSLGKVGFAVTRDGWLRFEKNGIRGRRFQRRPN
jgi:tRNA(Ile)-lysidine synthase